MILGSFDTLDALAREFPDVTLGQLVGALHLSSDAYRALYAEGDELRERMGGGGYDGIDAAAKLAALTTSASLYHAALAHRLDMFLAALHAALPQS